MLIPMWLVYTAVALTIVVILAFIVGSSHEAKLIAKLKANEGRQLEQEILRVSILVAGKCPTNGNAHGMVIEASKHLTVPPLVSSHRLREQYEKGYIWTRHAVAFCDQADELSANPPTPRTDESAADQSSLRDNGSSTREGSRVKRPEDDTASLRTAGTSAVTSMIVGGATQVGG